MIRAIFLDVDGTLISFSTHEIPASARRALTQAHERGVRLFIATGRAANDLGPLEGIPYDGVVSLNGARCVANDGRVVSLHPIPRADFERALALSEEQDFAMGLELEEGVFVNRVTPDVERVAHMVAHPVPEQTDLRELFGRVECCQLCFYFDAETQRREVAAFGDGGNDVAMLRAAGVGVAMGNACDEALNAADYVTASVDDDGIAKALAHLGVI